jgi:Tfp pilus assembly protein PilX
MTPRRDAGEHGFALIIAIVVLLFLTILGMTTLNSTVADINIAGKSRASSQALYIAQAGVSWGLDTLSNAPFTPSDVGTTLTNGALAGRTIAGTGTPLDGLLELPSSPVTFAGGTFRVGVGDDDDGDDKPLVDANGIIILRSLGVDSSGGKKLVEVTLGGS